MCRFANGPAYSKTDLSPEPLDATVARAQVLRSQVFHTILGSLFNWLAKPVSRRRVTNAMVLNDRPHYRGSPVNGGALHEDILFASLQRDQLVFTKGKTPAVIRRNLR
jgi:hypothetical protein